ncbi:MAG: c-type cytochrome [Cyanobacteria bacterium P01_A01_bin.84]
MQQLLIQLIKATSIFILFFGIISNPIALAVNIDNGAKIFNSQCAGCHLNGGNIIRRGKNLKLRALKRYKMDSVDGITNIVKSGKNNMSAYKDKLTSEEILDVATYVLQQAENNWK